MFLSSHKKIVIYMSGGFCTHGFNSGWGTPSLRRTHSYRNLLCKGPQEVQKYGITPPCREGERKTPFTEHKLHTNWEGEYAHKWSSVFSQRHHEQARCCKTVCPEIPRRSCQETPIHEQKGNNTRTCDSLTSMTFHPPVWNTSYFAKSTF